MAAAAYRPISASPMPGPARASCASSMAPTRSTNAPSPGWNCGSEWDWIARRASFETPPTPAPQDDEIQFMPSKTDVILRSGRSPRPEGRRAPTQPKLEAAELIHERPDDRPETARLEPHYLARLE